MTELTQYFQQLHLQVVEVVEYIIIHQVDLVVQAVEGVNPLVLQEQEIHLL